MFERLRGPWRVGVAEASMRPAIEPGDWLLIDPTVRRWPRPGSIVVIREPESDILAIKRVHTRPGGVVPDIQVTEPSTSEEVTVTVRLGPDEAWLVGDDPAVSIDSRRYGPVSVDRLVARAWFRYGPLGRIGRLR
ncbi:MAG: hypothetical protein E6I94_07980 [Chloroflexi bacterium]|nr:MAG: hypothetical protein E6I94_07980 [Chloroflexota bacterium]